MAANWANHGRKDGAEASQDWRSLLGKGEDHRSKGLPLQGRLASAKISAKAWRAAACGCGLSVGLTTPTSGPREVVEAFQNISISMLQTTHRKTRVGRYKVSWRRYDGDPPRGREKARVGDLREWQTDIIGCPSCPDFPL